MVAWWGGDVDGDRDDAVTEVEEEGGWDGGGDLCCRRCPPWYWACCWRICSVLDIGSAFLIVGLFEAGGMEGGGDSLSGLIPIAMSSWSNSAVSDRIWNQHTYRRALSETFTLTSPIREISYRHDNINEWEVRVGQPPRDLDRIFQRLPAPSPIHRWGSLVVPWETRMLLRSR